MVYLVQDMKYKDGPKSCVYSVIIVCGVLNHVQLSCRHRESFELCDSLHRRLSDPSAAGSRSGTDIFIFKMVVERYIGQQVSNLHVRLGIAQFSAQFCSPEVRRVMIAYTVDMILIFEELFKFTLVPTSDGIVTWKLLQEAFEAHHRTTAQNSVHTDIATRVEQTWRLDTNRDIVLEGVRDLLQQHRVV